MTAHENKTLQILFRRDYVTRHAYFYGTFPTADDVIAELDIDTRDVGVDSLSALSAICNRLAGTPIDALECAYRNYLGDFRICTLCE